MFRIKSVIAVWYVLLNSNPQSSQKGTQKRRGCDWVRGQHGVTETPRTPAHGNQASQAPACMWAVGWGRHPLHPEPDRPRVCYGQPAALLTLQRTSRKLLA